MNSDKPLETTAYFFFLANHYIKHDISSEYVMVDFICKGLLELWGTRVGNYKMKNICPQLDLNMVPSVYDANSMVIIVLLDLISIEHSKGDHVLPENKFGHAP